MSKITPQNPGTKKKNHISRRAFLAGTASTVAAFTIVPRHVLGGPGHTPPSEKLNIAGIGIGGQGGHDVAMVSSQNIVALCDVDDNHAAHVFKQYPKAKKYTDFRKMLEKQKDIDAVVIATPDHNHAIVAMTAMQLGKHVYCEKPLTHSVKEARMLTEAAHKYNVITQMGNQGHSGEGIRLTCEWIWAGAIGKVRKIDAWTDRPIWPQGIPLPKGTPPVPNTLDWNLWQGPAKTRPYNPAYLPFVWRGWYDYGTGALGDMACHILDPAFWALNLKYPTSVQASMPMVRSEQYSLTDRRAWGDFRNRPEPVSYPIASIVRYNFPARGDMPPVELNWYDGGLLPPRPAELEPGRRMGEGAQGIIFYGDKGTIMAGCYGRSPRIIPETKMREFMKHRPAKTIARVPGGVGGHQMAWVNACKSGKQPSSNFDYAGPLTETVVMGTIALRFPGQQLKWDGKNMKFTNVTDANKYVMSYYRPGWKLTI